MGLPSPDLGSTPELALRRQVFSRALTLLGQSGEVRSPQRLPDFSNLLLELAERPDTALYARETKILGKETEEIRTFGETREQYLPLVTRNQKVIFDRNPSPRLPVSEEAAIPQLRFLFRVLDNESVERLTRHVGFLADHAQNIAERKSAEGAQIALTIQRHQQRLMENAIHSQTTINFQRAWFEGGRVKWRVESGLQFVEYLFGQRLAVYGFGPGGERRSVLLVQFTGAETEAVTRTFDSLYGR